MIALYLSGVHDGSVFSNWGITKVLRHYLVPTEATLPSRMFLAWTRTNDCQLLIAIALRESNPVVGVNLLHSIVNNAILNCEQRYLQL